MISEQEAREQNLPGGDVFQWSQLAYKDPLNRDSFVVNLLGEAYKAFMLSTLIGKYELILREQETNAEEIRVTDPLNIDLPIHQSSFHWWRYDNINLENLLISTGFEISIRARLLSTDHLVQEVKEGDFEALYQKQKKQPIHKNELLAVSGYYYDQKLRRNYLLGLHSKTINYSLILKEDNYRKIINLPNEVIEVAEEYRNLRNQIHFPGDAVDSIKLNKYQGDSLVRFIVEYINSEIVDYSNTLINQNKLNGTPLERITYFD
jgi:hypothetical protein